MNYLILYKHRLQGTALWWRAERRGYTTSLDKAGRYSKEEADSIARIRGQDFPVPEDDIGRSLVVREIVSVEDGGNFDLLKSYENPTVSE